jgi:putative membrane protein insertion efficiency factor
MTTIVHRFAVYLVKGYQQMISPWLPASCRFTPTCSEFAIEALEQFGLIRGTGRAAARLLRCHPLHRGGFDPLT